MKMLSTMLRGKGALRARFDLTPRDSGTQLAGLIRYYHTSFQEHSIKVTRLACLTYDRLEYVHQAEMAVDTFCTTLVMLPFESIC